MNLRQQKVMFIFYLSTKMYKYAMFLYSSRGGLLHISKKGGLVYFFIPYCLKMAEMAPLCPLLNAMIYMFTVLRLALWKRWYRLDRREPLIDSEVWNVDPVFTNEITSMMANACFVLLSILHVLKKKSSVLFLNIAELILYKTPNLTPDTPTTWHNKHVYFTVND